MNLEIIRMGEGRPGRPPLLFIHGAFAGAWIWQENFLPFFADAGWECVALSLRGHGRSPGHERLDHFGLHHYVEDVATIAQGLDRPAVVIGHSMGGAVAQRFVSSHPAAGQVLVAGSPPHGFAGPAWWMAMHRPGFLWQLALLETLGKHYTDPEVLFRGFFSSGNSHEDAERFLPKLQRESARAMVELLVGQPIYRPRNDFATLVIGGDQDSFIPVSAMHSTAAFWQAQLIIQPGVPHVMMLDTTWKRTAEAILTWLEERF